MALKSVLDDSGLDIANLSSFGSDGASVQKRRSCCIFKALNGNMISIHCVAN